MANKWIRKLGMGMSVIMTVSQLSTGMVLAAPEEGFDDYLEDKFEDELEDEPIYEEDDDTCECDYEESALIEEQDEIDVLYTPAAKSLPSLTGDQRADAVAIANSQVGYVAGGSNGYDNIFSVELANAGWNCSPGGQWCGVFVAWCAYKAGLPKDKWPSSLASTSGTASGFESWGRWHPVNSGYTPQPGDFVAIKNAGSSSIGHSGIVYSVSDSAVVTIEGNYISNGNHKVASATYRKNSNGDWATSWGARIGGYGTPDYNGSQSTPQPQPKEYTPFDIARIANGEVGTVGGSKYSSNSGGWAAYFANWCYRSAGADTTTWPEYANVTKFIQYFQGLGRWHDKVNYTWSYKEYSGGGSIDSYIPQWGDFVVIETNDNDGDGPDTGGIVVGRSMYDDRIEIVVGNQDNKVVSYTYKMSTGYPIDGSTASHIVGVCNPDFKGNFINGTVEKVEAGAGTIHVKGWTFDYDDLSASLPVSVYVGGEYDNSSASRYDIVANIERSDINKKYGVNGAHGFDATIEVDRRGTQDVWIYSNDIGTKAFGGINLGAGTGFSVNITDQIAKINVTGVSMDIYEATLPVGVDQVIYATVAPSNAEDKTLVWKSSNTSVVTVDQKGNFSTLAPGKAIITVTATNGTSDTTDDVSATCIITVFEDKPDPTTTPDPTGTEKPTVTPEPTGTEEPTIPPTPTGSENTSAKIAVTNITDNDATITVQLNEIQNVSNVFVNVWQGASYWNSDNVCYEFYDVNKATDYFSFNISDIDAKLEPGKQYGVTLSIYCDSGYIMPDDVTFTTSSTHGSDPTPAPKDPESTPRLEVGTDGQTHCYINGVEDDYYSGLALYDDGKGERFVYVSYGQKDTSKLGFTDYEGGKFLIVKGEIETGANGLVQDIDNPADWYYCANGQVQSQYTGLAYYDGEWFYINRGKLNTTLTAYVSYDGGLFYVAAGRIVQEVNGLAKDPNGTAWYYLANGQAQTQYTGLAQYDGAWFYVVRGKLAENYTGNVNYDGATFYVVNGMLR